MNRKPKNYSDMLKTVAAVSHPDLKAHHRNLLNALALSAHSNGEGSRPGHEALKIALGGKSDKWVARLLGELRHDMKLIDLTHRGRGDGNASIYKLCLENTAYPDWYPGLKDEKSKSEVITNHRAQYHQPKDEVSPTDDTVITNHVVPTIQLPIQNPSNLPAIPQNKIQLTLPPEGWGDSPLLSTMGATKPNQLRQLQELARPYGEHGWELLRYVIQRWQDQRPRGMVGLNEPWFFFLSEMNAGRIKRMVDESFELLKIADPASYNARLKAIDENYRKAHNAVWKLPEPEKEPDLTDLFGPNTSYEG